MKPGAPRGGPPGLDGWESGRRNFGALAVGEPEAVEEQLEARNSGDEAASVERRPVGQSNDERNVEAARDADVVSGGPT